MKYLVKYIIILAGCYSTLAMAIHPDSDVARAAQNPLARNPGTQYYSMAVNNSFESDYGSKPRSRDILYLKPVIPISLSPDYDLITRSIFPLYHQANTDKGGGYINGTGDLNSTFFISPTLYETWIWAVGPTVYIPTATNEALSSGAWSAGPELVVQAMPGPWVVGFLASNLWAFKSQPDVETANQLTFEYYLSYNFDHGWYVTTQPSITANWNVPSNDVWTVPVGGGFGRAFHIHKQACNASLQAYYNPIRPQNLGPLWTIELNMSFLYPRHLGE